MNLVLNGRQKTLLLGELFGSNIKDSCFIALEGPLGAGKTTFVKGLAQGLGVREVVQSPTFTMLNEYHSGRLPLYHLDLYRLSESTESQARALGEQLLLELDEVINSNMVCVIEWSELFKLIREDDSKDISYLDELDHLTIRFSYETGSKSETDHQRQENPHAEDSNEVEQDPSRSAFLQGFGTLSQRTLDEVVGEFLKKVAE